MAILGTFVATAGTLATADTEGVLTAAAAVGALAAATVAGFAEGLSAASRAAFGASNRVAVFAVSFSARSALLRDESVSELTGLATSATRSSPATLKATAIISISGIVAVGGSSTRVPIAAKPC
jgi:hypothetical protein